MPTQSEIAGSPDFTLGPLLVSPSRRQVFNPEQKSVAVEPRIMQVLTLLAERRGQVVSRQELFDAIWGGVAVGDDSLNRAVAGVRRALELAPDAFELETIPRTGYRLAVIGEERTAATNPIGRRAMIGGALALGAVAGGVGLWKLSDELSDEGQARKLVEQGKEMIRAGLPSQEAQDVVLLQKAVQLDPSNAEAWGLLAFAQRNVVENGTPDRISSALTQSQSAATRALAIDPNQGFALSAQAMLQPEFGDWAAAERKLRDVLRRAPGTVPAMQGLTLLLQSVGRCIESNHVNDQVLAIDPVNPIAMFRGAYKHWILGDLPAADQVIERTLALWPRHPAVWNARLLLFAFTDRPNQGLAMLNDRQLRPPNLKPETISFWTSVLHGFADRFRLDEARSAMLAAAPRSPGYAYYSIMAFSGLGLVDDAYDAARGYFLKEGPLSGRSLVTPGQLKINDMQWRRTMILFLPVTAAVRADPRFASFCDAIGLSEYWEATGTRPDILPSDRAYRSR